MVQIWFRTKQRNPRGNLRASSLLQRIWNRRIAEKTGTWKLVALVMRGNVPQILNIHRQNTHSLYFACFLPKSVIRKKIAAKNLAFCIFLECYILKKDGTMIPRRRGGGPSLKIKKEKVCLSAYRQIERSDEKD